VTVELKFALMTLGEPLFMKRSVTLLQLNAILNTTGTAG
jgi:hypothetical protein